MLGPLSTLTPLLMMYLLLVLTPTSTYTKGWQLLNPQNRPVRRLHVRRHNPQRTRCQSRPAPSPWTSARLWLYLLLL